MSERIAPSSSIAVGRDRLHPVLAEALDHQRGRRADGVERRAHRHARLDRADVVVVEDLDDLGLLDAEHALRLLGVVDEQHLARRRVDEVGARDEADRAAVAVDRHGRAVVDVLDRLGDVGQQVVGRDGQRLAVHQRPARRRQRDHAAGHVAVQRRGDDRGPALAREREDVVVRPAAVAGHEQRDAEVDRDPLRVRAVADDDHVAGLEAERQRVDVHRQHPDAAR